MFHFDEYVDIDEVKTDLQAYAIYNAKNSFFDEYEMTKYANRLYKDHLGELAEMNLSFLRNWRIKIRSSINIKVTAW
jgi:hypothetical protein